MNRDPILIRVDATPRTGFERFARCMTLAAALQRRRRPTFFFSQLEPPALAFSVKRSGNDWVDACHPAGTPDDLEDLIQEIRRRRPAAVIVDEGDVTHEYLAELVATGVLVVSLDHQANIRFPSGILVNPLLGPSRESYEFFEDTQLLLNHATPWSAPRSGGSGKAARKSRRQSWPRTGNLARPSSGRCWLWARMTRIGRFANMPSCS